MRSVSSHQKGGTLVPPYPHVLPFLLVLLSAFAFAQSDKTASADDIARAILIGQAYPSGNVYVAGFMDDHARAWPGEIKIVTLHPSSTDPVGARLQRPAPGADISQSIAKEGDIDFEIPNTFHTIDRMEVVDRPLAMYESRALRQSAPVVGWDNTLTVTGLSFRQRGARRPVRPAERTEIREAQRAIPKDVECTTEPRWLDSAEIILSATVTPSGAAIYLSKYETPGCLGHLAIIYVLDVTVPGRDPKRFEFSHYAGLL
jgi:hypothetical protein